MTDKKRHRLIEAVLMIATYLITPVVILFLCSLLSGCKTVERESVVVKSDTLHHYTERRDSVVYHDSVFVHLYEKGDTIYSITERWNVQYRDRVKIDTVYVRKYADNLSAHRYSSAAQKSLDRGDSNEVENIARRSGGGT